MQSGYRYIGYGRVLELCLLLLLSFLWVEGQAKTSRLPSRGKAIVLDNPTKKAIVCYIDGKPYHVVAGGRSYLQLTNGKHNMVYKGDTTAFVKGRRDGGSILNPTRSTYVLVGVDFPRKDEVVFVTRCGDPTEIEGEYYAGPYIPLNASYLRKYNGEPEFEWYWGLDEEIPEDIVETRLPFMRDNKDYWVYKIYRYEDFKQIEKPLFKV